jgi:hypothetical protein
MQARLYALLTDLSQIRHLIFILVDYDSLEEIPIEKNYYWMSSHTFAFTFFPLGEQQP